MSELKPAELIILEQGRKTTTIRAVQGRLMRELRTRKIGYCIDFLSHPVLGRNKGFTVMQPKDGGNHVLVQIRAPGDEPIVPHEYLGSILHPNHKNIGERYVHFYLIKRIHTPQPATEKGQKDD